MFVITYWHDEDEDTITSVSCETEAECNKICEVLNKYGMSVISAEELNTTTADEIEAMLKEAYGE